MAKHSFIVELELSTHDVAEAATIIHTVISNWLKNLSFASGQQEKLIRVKHISRITPKTDYNNINNQSIGVHVEDPIPKFAKDGDTAINTSKLAPTSTGIVQQSEDGDNKEQHSNQ